MVNAPTNIVNITATICHFSVKLPLLS